MRRLCCIVWLICLASAHAQEAPMQPPGVANTPAVLGEAKAPENASEFSPWNLPSATGGGKQFWTDLTILDGWRIQRNALSGHCRLLDARDVRRAWGTLEHCEAELEEARVAHKLSPPRGKVVIALHGLLRSRHQLQPMCDWLEKEGGYTVINFNYASSRAEVGEHAEALARIVAQCDEADEINFVAHSLGNIVLRHYLGDCESGVHGLKPNPRIRRIVMLGPPNNGAEFAKRFSENKVFQLVWGKSGQQLADNWPKLAPHLATPGCEFGIIAGGWGTELGLNPLVAGDDDGVVSVSETKLAGACDFAIARVWHGDLMDDVHVRKAILKFLQEGCFVAADKRCPLPADDLQKAAAE